MYEGGSIQFFRVNAKFEHKLRRHKQTLGKIATKVDERFLGMSLFYALVEKVKLLEIVFDTIL